MNHNEPHISSRLLNRQIKYAMLQVQVEETMAVLDELEKSLKTKTIDTWASTFCTILILCLCMENLQTAADTFIIASIEKDGERSKYRREQGLEACQALEQFPYENCVRFFHEVYRSHKEARAFNPLQEDLGSEQLGWNRPKREMVEGIRRLMDKQSKFRVLGLPSSTQDFC